MEDGAKSLTDLFLSYSHHDGEEAGALRSLAESEGLSVWIDESGLPPGERWRDEVRTAILGTSCFAFLVSPESLVSPHCQMELDFAEAHGKRILPLVLEERGAKLRLPEEGPLAESQRLVITVDSSGSVEPGAAIVSAIKREAVWRRRSSEYLLRARRWQEEPRSILATSELDQALKWLHEGSRMRPPPSPLVRRFIQESSAEQQRAAAEWKDLSLRSRSRQLAAEARLKVDAEPDLALLLAIEAMITRDLFEARAALLHCLTAHRRLLGCVHHRPSVPLEALALSPGGDTLATLGWDGIVLWSVPKLERIATIPFDVPPRCLALGQVSTRLAVGVTKQVLLFDAAESREPVATLGARDALVTAVTFGPDDSTVVCGCSDGLLAIYDLSDETFHEHRTFPHTVSKLQWAADQQRLLVQSGDSVWSLDWTGAEPDLESSFPEILKTFSLSADEKLLVGLVSNEAGDVAMWRDLETGEEGSVQVSDLAESTYGVAWGADLDRLVTVGRGRQIEQKLEIRLGESTRGLMVDPTGLGRDLDNAAEWSRASGRKVDTLLKGFDRSIRDVKFEPQRRLLAAAGDAGTAYLWHAGSEDCSVPYWIFHPDQGPFTAVAYAPASALLAVGMENGTLAFVSSIESGGDIVANSAVSVGESAITHLAWQGDGTRLLVVDAAGALSIYQPEGPRLVARAEAEHGSEITAAGFSCLGRWIATTTRAGAVEVRQGLDLAQARLLLDDGPEGFAMPLGQEGEIDASGKRWEFTALAIHPRAELALVGGEDGCVRVFDLGTGDIVARSPAGGLPGATGGIAQLAFHPTQARLVVASGYGLQTLDPAALDNVGRSRSAHRYYVDTFVISQDGAFAVSCDRNDVLLWDLPRFEVVGSLASRAPLAQITCSADGRQVAGCGGGRMIILEAHPDAWVRYAREKANRPLSDAERSRFLDEQAPPDGPASIAVLPSSEA